MLLNRKTGYSITVAMILALVLLLTPILSGFALANIQTKNEDNHTCSACADKEILEYGKAKFGISADVLTEDIAQGYINTVLNSSTFKTEKLAFGDKVVAIRVKPLNIVQVYGLASSSKNTIIAGFLNANTGDLISVTTLIWDGLEDNNKVVTTKYLPNGKKIVYNNTMKELKLQKAKKDQKIKEYMSKKWINCCINRLGTSCL